MDATLTKFLESAKGFSRNPLGIVALFISLIYGFANLLLGSAISQLSADERRPLVWFIVIFPLVVLCAFYRLVTNHHWKLYSPRDYKSDQSFLDTITAQDKKLRDSIIDEELETIAIPSAPLNEVPSSIESSEHKQDPTTPDYARARAVREKYIQAEKLALIQISNDLGVPVKENVTINKDRSMAFDGIAFDPVTETIFFIETKLLTRPFISTTSIREAVYRAVLGAEQAKHKTPGLKPEMIFVIVTDNMRDDDAARCRERIERATHGAPIDIRIKHYDYNALVSQNSNPQG